jgi:hypothetical protein
MPTLEKSAEICSFVSYKSVRFITAICFGWRNPGLRHDIHTQSQTIFYIIRSVRVPAKVQSEILVFFWRCYQNYPLRRCDSVYCDRNSTTYFLYIQCRVDRKFVPSSILTSFASHFNNLQIICRTHKLEISEMYFVKNKATHQLSVIREMPGFQ